MLQNARRKKCRIPPKDFWRAILLRPNSSRLGAEPLEEEADMLQMDLSALSTSILPSRDDQLENTFSVVAHDSIARSCLESTVRSGFGTHFGACIAGFMPRFAYYEHSSGGTGVIGLRRASEEPLFLENYLDRPIETILAEVSDTLFSRDRIAEVGQFVVDDRNIVGSFFRDLVPFLASEDCDWVCFTGTNKIRAILKRVGFEGLPIAVADESRVASQVDSWGDYYDHDPVVIVGKLDDPQGHWINDVLSLQPSASTGC